MDSELLKQKLICFQNNSEAMAKKFQFEVQKMKHCELLKSQVQNEFQTIVNRGLAIVT